MKSFLKGYIPIIHALATWTIAGISIWAIWFSDFGEQTAALLKREIVEQKDKVTELKQEDKRLQGLLENKESELAKYQLESEVWKERILLLQTDVQQVTEQLVNEFLIKLASDAGQWMVGHKVRAEVASKWKDHLEWMEKLKNWEVGDPDPEIVPYIWHLGLIREDGRGEWYPERYDLGDCGQTSIIESGLALDAMSNTPQTNKWLHCGKEFEKKFLNSVTDHNSAEIYTLGDLRQELEKTYMGKIGSERIVSQISEIFQKKMDDHGATDAMLLRLSLDIGAKTDEIVNTGGKVLDNYRTFEAALTSLKEDLEG